MEHMEGATSIERMLIRQASQKRTPINGSIELLPLCNMNCDMCYVRLSREEMERQGKLRTADEWIDLAKQMKEAGVLFLLLTGGEPLIYPDFKRLYLELRSMGMILTINTNGTLIDEEWAAFFGQYKPRRINITLYGADERAYRELCHYPGGFDRTIRGIRLLREQGVDVKVNGSLVKNNVDDGVKIAQIAKGLGAALHVDTYMYPATRERGRPYNEQARLAPEDAARARVQMMKEEYSPERFKHIAMSMLHTAAHTPPDEEVPGGMRCMAGSCSFTINWQGQMRPCVMLTSPSISVFDIGFDAAWKATSEGVQSIRLSAKCSGCTMREICTTCAACALYESGSLDGVPEYACRYTAETLNCLAKEMQMAERTEAGSGER